MAQAVFDHFDSIMGTQGCQQVQLQLNKLHLPVLNDVPLDQCFTEEEIWQAILDMPTDKASGLDGFTVFLQDSLAYYESSHFKGFPCLMIGVFTW